MIKDIHIICATPLSADDFWQTAPLANFLGKIDVEEDSRISYVIYYNNIIGLAKIYNKEITKKNKDKIVVFVHDDVDIQDFYLVEKLNTAIVDFDVIGLAGGKNINLKSPALWHIMTERSTWSGAVGHIFADKSIAVSSFGPAPRRCLLIDGLFIAINTEKVLETGVKFDPQYDFHFYDLDFALSANAAKLKIGTAPIWVIHAGLGDSYKSEEWKTKETSFLEKWATAH